MVLKRKKKIQIKQVPKKEIILTRNLLKIIPPGKLLKIDDAFYRSKIKPELDNCEVGVPTSREFFLQEKSELGQNATVFAKGGGNI